jgi:hypothetical protein
MANCKIDGNSSLSGAAGVSPADGRGNADQLNGGQDVADAPKPLWRRRARDPRGGINSMLAHMLRTTGNEDGALVAIFASKLLRYCKNEYDLIGGIS